MCAIATFFACALIIVESPLPKKKKNQLKYDVKGFFAFILLRREAPVLNR